jgi:hypothetical protein
MTVSGADHGELAPDDAATRDAGADPAPSANDRVTSASESTPSARPTTRAAWFAWSAVAVILVGVTVLVVYALTRGTTPPDVSRAPVTSSDVLASLSSVPSSVDDTVGAGTATTQLTPPVLLSGQPPLESSGKPEVLFVGAEYCPFCAAERWPLVLALSRFGRFSVLHNVQSASNDAFSGIQSFSFVHAAYSSPYVAFTGVELYSTSADAEGGYAKIASLTPGQSALLARDGTRSGTVGSPAIPFVDIANRMVTSISGFSPAVLVGQSQAAIVADLGQPDGPVAEAVVAAANELTAGICQATGGRPGDVCSSKGVRAADAALGLR